MFFFSYASCYSFVKKKEAFWGKNYTRKIKSLGSLMRLKNFPFFAQTTQKDGSEAALMWYRTG